MQYETLLVEMDNGIAIVTVNRPKALNALNRQTFSDIKQFFEVDAPKIKGLKGVIVTGAGDKAFVAGADITEFSSLKGATDGAALAKRGQDIFTAVERFTKPVIACVNGFALGGGCEFAMACHFRIASENARFGQPEVNLGIIPGYGGTQRLTRYVGKGKAMELLMTGDMIKAPEALSLGLVNYVLPQEELISKAKSIIEKIAAKGPIAVAKIIETVNAYYENEDGFKMEYEEFGNITETEDFKEGSAAFLEKRAANFKGK